MSVLSANLRANIIQIKSLRFTTAIKRCETKVVAANHTTSSTLRIEAAVSNI